MGRRVQGADLAETSRHVLDRGVNVVVGLYDGVALGLLSQRSLDELDRRYYVRQGLYASREWNVSGLQPWEAAAVSACFPPSGRILVLAAGGGREVLALEQQGYDVTSFEPAQHLVERANEILAGEGATSRVERIARNGVPEGGTFDAVVIGWSAYTLVRGRAQRLALLRAVAARCVDGAPILLSFFDRPDPSRPHSITAAVGSILARVARRQKVELGDSLRPNYVHCFTREELLSELTDAGLDPCLYESRPYPHAVARTALPSPARVAAARASESIEQVGETHGLTELDIALGSPQGEDPCVEPWDDIPVARSPRASLEAAVLRAMQRPPVVVAFSGGRDSSVLLAVATAVARREGLPLPVPVTQRFAGAPKTDEREWQELVVRHLRLADWEILDLDDELDLFGSSSAPVVREWGVRWPMMPQQLVPLARAAAGGTLITGYLGDEIATPWPDSQRRAREVLRGRTRPRASDYRRVGLAVAPHALRRRVLARTNKADLPWLNEHGRRASADVIADPISRYLADWRDGLENLWRGRYRRLFLDGNAELCRRHDATYSAPLADEGVLRALAAGFPATGPAWGEVHRSLAADLVPADVFVRRDKAEFGEVVFGEATLRFARSWTGEGVVNRYVDCDALRETWRSAPTVDVRSTLLLVSAWSAVERGDAS